MQKTNRARCRLCKKKRNKRRLFMSYWYNQAGGIEVDWACYRC
jgi:hypothetical protein